MSGNFCYKIGTMKKTLKVEYILSLLLGAGFFNSCANVLVDDKLVDMKKPEAHQESQFIQPTTLSGSYLAAKIAHLRQEMDLASRYYARTVDIGSHHPEVIGRAYLLLAFDGKIDEAHRYAQIARQNGDQNYIISFLDMTYYVAANDFDLAYESLKRIKEEVYKTAVFPPFNAWIEVGKGNKEKALAALEGLNSEEGLSAMYYMHKGLINEYFDDPEAAAEAFDAVVQDENIEISFRSLQLISNFYLRHGRRKEAQDLIEKYYEKNNSPVALSQLYRQIEDGSVETPKMIDTPQKGVAEALFNISTVFRAYRNEVAQIFSVFALYLNPDHDVARVAVADMFENSQQFDKARQEYAKIARKSAVYYMARYKAASLYMKDKDYFKALQELEKLNREYPQNYQILFDLGEVCRMVDDPASAIRYYNQALSVPNQGRDDWIIYYALGMAYERNNNWDKAEEVLQKALEISDRHPIVLNYLGYSWLKINKNPNEALFMIFEAYSQNPENGYIVDSLGWALYRMGKYDDAVKVLERATMMLPDNALVCDHLGDAYWQSGRKDEAKYQWERSLTLKDEEKELNLSAIHDKLENGLEVPATLLFNETLLVERLKDLNL